MNRSRKYSFLTTLLITVALTSEFRVAHAQQDATGPIDAERLWTNAAQTTYWVNTEYLLWWLKGQQTPPLVTTGPASQGLFPGFLGQPGTTVLLGGDTRNLAGFSGGRFTLGGWLDTERIFGLETSYFFLGQQTASRSVASNGTPSLSIPYFDPTLPGENTTGLASALGLFSGTGVLTYSTRLQGAEANALAVLTDCGAIRLDGLVGFRWLNLSESLTFATASPSLAPAPPGYFFTRDRFQTRNDFYGGQLGLRGETAWGRFFLQGTAKVALGSMDQTTRISGFLSTDTIGAGPKIFPGGYFTAPTNLGEHSRSRFAVIPEVNLNAGVQLSPRIRLSAGYSFLYVSSVARPGDAIDRTINPTQLPSYTGSPTPALVGPSRPTFAGNDSSFWAHGLNFGVELRY